MEKAVAVAVVEGFVEEEPRTELWRGDEAEAPTTPELKKGKSPLEDRPTSLN